MQNSLKDRFEKEGIDKSYLSSIVNGGFDRGTLDFDVEPLSVGMGLHSKFYRLSVSDDHGREAVFFVKEPLLDTDLYGGKVPKWVDDPAGYEFKFLSRLPTLEGRVYLHKESGRILTPFYDDTFGSLLLDYFRRYKGKISDEERLPISNEVLGRFKQVCNTILETNLGMVDFPTRVGDTLQVDSPTEEDIETRLRAYLNALYVLKYGSPHGRGGSDPLDRARESLDPLKRGEDFVRWSDNERTDAMRDLEPIISFVSKGASTSRNVHLVHGDCRPENIVFKTMPDDRLEYCLIDWGNAGLGPVSLDLITFANSYELKIFKFPESIRQQMLDTLYNSMAADRAIASRRITSLDQLSRGVSRTEEEHRIVSEDYLNLSIWENIKRAGLFALFINRYSRQYEKFVKSRGNLDYLYEAGTHINAHLREFIRLCEDAEMDGAAEIATSFLDIDRRDKKKDNPPLFTGNGDEEKRREQEILSIR